MWLVTWGDGESWEMAACTSEQHARGFAKLIVPWDEDLCAIRRVSSALFHLSDGDRVEFLAARPSGQKEEPR